MIAVKDVLAAVAEEDPMDISSDAWRAIVGYRSAMADVRQLRRSDGLEVRLELSEPVQDATIELKSFSVNILG